MPTSGGQPENRIGTVGFTFPGVSVGLGTDQEILVTGGNVCVGHFKDEETIEDLEEIRALVKSQRKVLRSLLGVFDPQNLDATVAALQAAQEQDDAATARQEAVRRTIAGLHLTYDVDQYLMEVEARPNACTQVCVGGGTRTLTTRQPWHLELAA